jgi:hypothetical protein
MSPVSNKPSAKPETVVSPAASNRTVEEDKVGYRNPPKASRFVKGQSGNPKGRKTIKKIKDIGVVFEEVLNEPVQVREGEQHRTMTRLEATIQALRAKALKGDPKAIRGLLKLAEKVGMFAKSPRKSLIEITEPAGIRGKMFRMYHAEQDAIQRSKDEIIAEAREKISSGQEH